MKTHTSRVKEDVWSGRIGFGASFLAFPLNLAAWGLLGTDPGPKADPLRHPNAVKHTEKDGTVWIEYICFIKGTDVFTQKGYIKIENLKIGDEVYSYNELVDSFELKKVVAIAEHKSSEILELNLGREFIYVTEEHPFFIEGKGWIQAKNISVNDVCKSFEKKLDCKVFSVKKIKRDNQVYNLEVADNHNYFVGRSRILVHNKNYSFIQQILNKHKL